MTGPVTALGFVAALDELPRFADASRTLAPTGVDLRLAHAKYVKAISCGGPRAPSQTHSPRARLISPASSRTPRATEARASLRNAP
jgi:hypothetical protein